MQSKKGIELWNRAKKRIPSGNQLLSKRAEMFLPDKWPAYYSKVKGCEVWDLDGNRYLDMSIAGVSCCSLGYADPDIDNAVVEAIKCGNMSTLNVPEEVELADLLCEIHPWAEMVKYARTGGEAMAVAVRIVRAATRRDRILFCGYHGWHDWYLSANLAKSDALDGQLLPGLLPLGVPRGLYNTSIPFRYNDLESFKSLVEEHGDTIAGVVMEPLRNFWPQEGFLEGIRRITGERGIPLVFDEVTAAFRLNTGGVHQKLGVEPDVAVFAKALGNGYPMAAIIGRSRIMQAAQDSFISSTYWTDKIGPVAALATLKKHKRLNVGDHLTYIGDLVQEGWKHLAKKHDLKIAITGISPLSHWEIQTSNSQLLHTIIVERMLQKGILTSKSLSTMYTHTREHVEAYLSALDGVLGELGQYIKENRLQELPHGPVAHSGFQRLT